MAYDLLVPKGNTKLARLRRTSVQVEPRQIAALRRAYPKLTKSEIIRVALAYLLEREPRVTPAQPKFEEVA